MGTAKQHKQLRGSLAALLMAAVLAVQVAPASAAGLRVSPLRVDLTERTRSGTLNLDNLARKSVAVEVTLVRWTQEGSNEVYTPTRDLFFAPPIVNVPAGGSAAIRLRTKTLPAPGEEATYRLYVRELPDAQQRESGGAGLALRIGIPVYVQNGPVPPPRLGVAASRSDNGVQLRLNNSGASHIKIKGIEAHAADVNRRAKPPEPLARAQRIGGGTNDLMPDGHRNWLIPNANLPGDTQILLRTDSAGGRAAEGMLRNGWLWVRLADLLAD